VGLNYRAGGLSARRDEGRELLRCARRMYKLCDTPLFITCAVRGGDDAQSCRTLFRLLAAVSGSELPIRRYYHWPLLEGFAWPGSGPDCAWRPWPGDLDRAVTAAAAPAAIARSWP
jgi:hypothetical protein